MSGRLAVLPVLVLACVALICAAGVRFVLSCGGMHRTQGEAQRQDVHLRSFAPGASGSLTVLQGPGGVVRVRLTALHLPRPQSLDARAGEFVVWAVGSGGRVVNLGTIERDERGNGALEFASPSSLEHYSVMVTAEASARATGPMGPPVLTTRAGEVGAFAGGGDANRIETRGSNTATTPPESVGSRSTGGNNFYAEVDEALGRGETRTLTLAGGEIAPGARGLARVTSLNGKTFVRARITRLPSPSAVGANIYALWAHAPDGRTAYLGSLPANINETEIYVRARLAFNAFDLFVTAENGRPAIYPSSRRALGTAISPRSPRRRFWRRHRRAHPAAVS